MPSRRSKSRDRERKRLYRQEMSAKKKDLEKQKTKDRMQRMRLEMSESEKDKVKKEKKEYMRKRRSEKGTKMDSKETLTSKLWGPGLLFGETELYKRQKEMERKRMKDKRAKFTLEEMESENRGAKLRMRVLREKQTAEEKQAYRDKNKERMRNFRLSKKMIHDSSDDQSIEESSDIVKKLNDIHRNERECRLVKAGNDRKSESEDCTCDFDIDCISCAAQNEAEKNLYTLTSKEESDRFQKEELEAYRNQKKNERKEKRKVLIEKAKKPLKPLPNREPSEYEKIREDLIAQRQKEWLVYEKKWEEQWQRNKKKND